MNKGEERFEIYISDRIIKICNLTGRKREKAENSQLNKEGRKETKPQLEQRKIPPSEGTTECQNHRSRKTT